MTGLDTPTLDPKAKEAVAKNMKALYTRNLCDLSQIEDIELFTDGRANYPNIGTGEIRMNNMKYVAEHAFWINVCLYVNKDFRACFNDAITIERALQMVNDQEYADFRDEMTLDSDDADLGPAVAINFSRYSDKLDGFVDMLMSKARTEFRNAGMIDVYDDLAINMDRADVTDVSFIINNMVYIINAFNRNGVFRKYVTLVIDSVRKQLT